MRFFFIYVGKLLFMWISTEVQKDLNFFLESMNTELWCKEKASILNIWYSHLLSYIFDQKQDFKDVLSSKKYPKFL